MPSRNAQAAAMIPTLVAALASLACAAAIGWLLQDWGGGVATSMLAAGLAVTLTAMMLHSPS